ncbi:hypothetical protein VTK73DRAFT_2982 [Phialemonium thermophilum]|uniref:Uncharacterized protein n=1 Tax=Phialemonium thermophilum TaxID=223376 RepID=A0ABR3Y1Z7_9PEZI
MLNHTPHDSATSNVLAWTTHSANVEPCAEEEIGDADEPPDLPVPVSPITNHFKRAPVRRGSEHHESLLTRALQSHSEDETQESRSSTLRRRRSMTSNVSVASTTDLTCDTGITTPARTGSPSPRCHDVKVDHGIPATSRPSTGMPSSPPGTEIATSATVETKPTEKKRCISFACAAKPSRESREPKPTTSQTGFGAVKPVVKDGPKRPCIKFACPSQPAATKNQPLQQDATDRSLGLPEDTTFYAARKTRSPSIRSVRPVFARRSSGTPSTVRSKKYIIANSRDLQSESSRFHEFASEEPEEDDWIRCDGVVRGRLTIDDTLQKENAIRKLAKEAEEEAELEEDVDDETADGENVDNEDDEPDLEEDGNGDLEDDEYSGYGSDDDVSDGYNTDNETGFAESEDEDDGLVLWTTGEASNISSRFSNRLSVHRRSSFNENLSDSSILTKPRHRSSRAKNITARPGTPELPDSTDFVCGTLDEDRPLEEAYISCIAARRLEKLHLIPQDIDPSFPTSEPEDDEDDTYNTHGHRGDDDLMWFHGEPDDIHQEINRVDRRRKDEQSPKRYHSPPPRRHHSPAPKGRVRSPRRHFDKLSPKRCTSPPPPQPCRSPLGSLVQTGQGIAFNKPPAFRPGLVYTKSLPRAPVLLPPLKKRGRSGTVTKGNHVRGAIDIVKGLEQKRQRRKEKFYQKYCSRARKNQGQSRRPAPGQGAERMREVGLIMAGKIGPGNYVISV